MAVGEGMRYEVRPETRLGPGPYSVYVDGEYLTTVDTKAEVERVKAEQDAKAASERR
jgi:hypothetical protein